MVDDPAQFYTGLVAELYESLISERATADQYAPFLERSGTPALELACGSGLPLLDLVARGFDVEGLDASPDMLALLQQRASERSLAVTVHLARMQDFALPRRYRSIFVAGASFILLTSDDDALRTLRGIHAHLEPGGTALIPIEINDKVPPPEALNQFREMVTDDGTRLRFAMVGAHLDGNNLVRRLRYERIAQDGTVERIERNWVTRNWSQPRFRELLNAAGFSEHRFRAPEGGPATDDARVYVALAARQDQ